MAGLASARCRSAGCMTEDFSNIKLLATPVGKVQIIDEASFHGKQQEVSAKLAELTDFYDCAFWTFFEQPDCWNGAVSFAAADGKSKRYWRKRINMPRLDRRPTPADGRALGSGIVTLFRQQEGRGDYCTVHQYRRGAHGEKEYYFAYPQDHRQMAIEYNKGEMTRRPHKPAFEVIFIHDDEQRTLSIWHQGKKERVNDLQVVFANAVLGQAIPRESPRDDRAYDLDAFLDPYFIFQSIGTGDRSSRYIQDRYSRSWRRAILNRHRSWRQDVWPTFSMSSSEPSLLIFAPPCRGLRE